MTFKPARLLAVLLAMAAMPAMAQVATVNGKTIPSTRLNAIVKDVEAGGQQDSEELRKKITSKMIELEIYSQEAEKEGVDKDPAVKEKIALSRQNVLAGALFQARLKNAVVSDAEVAAEYEKLKAQAAQHQEYHAHHILVQTEDEAKDIIAKLKNGAKFEDLAKEKSIDPQSAPNGGDLGWATPDNYVDDFSAAMVKLEKGQFTETPVQSKFGFHVIRLDEKREGKAAPLEDIKPRLVEAMKQKQAEDFMTALKDKAKVTVGGAAPDADKADKKKSSKK